MTERYAHGIRPEALGLAEDPDASGILSGKVDLVEWLGSELFVHLDLGVSSLDPPPALAAEGVNATGASLRAIMRLDPHAQIQSGRTLGLVVDLSRLHLFHPESGASLRFPRAP